MRQVRTCDFCGDDAAGVYEPLPPSIPDAPRMILCDACRDRLSSVVDPLLARLEGGPGGDAGDSSARDTGDRDATTAYRDLEVDSRDDSPGRSSGDDLEAREWPADPRERADEGSTGADDVSDVAGREQDAPDEVTAAADDPGRPTDEPAESSAAPNQPSQPAPDDAGDASADTETPPTSVDDLTDDGGVEVSESRDASGRSQRERGGAPRGYRKVLRFLENRQLPVDRAEAERLAAEAYDLDVGEVGAAIDHAVQYGRLREVSGELRR